MKRLLVIFSQMMSVLSTYRARTVIAAIGALPGAIALVPAQNISLPFKKKVVEDITFFGDRVFMAPALVLFNPGQMMRRERIKSMKLPVMDVAIIISGVINYVPVTITEKPVKYKSYLTTAKILVTTPDYFPMNRRYRYFFDNVLIMSRKVTETGVKRAIGATKCDIMPQFVMESGYIGRRGGILGIITRSFLTVAIGLIGGLPFVILFFGVFIGFIASLPSGMLAGLYPAFGVSRIMPVEALRL